MSESMTAKVQIIVSRNNSWVWRAETDIDPEMARTLSDDEFKLVREALPRLLKELLSREPVTAAPAPKRKK